MEAQYDGLVSGDADRGKKGSTLGVTARAQWRGSIGMKPDTWVGLEHKAWETVLFLRDNEDLDVISYPSSVNHSEFRSRVKYFLRGPGSASAMDALLWTLIGSWGLLIEDWDSRLKDWTVAAYHTVLC